MKFSRLTVIKRVPHASRNARWECVCQCGNLKQIFGQNLLSGRIKSCGCLRRQQWESRRKERVIQNGYVFVKMPDHPRANPHTGRVREHIVIMETLLGRPLLPGEEVHHRNADRADNRPENLELWITSQPNGARVADQVAWAKEILRRYEPESLTTP